MTDFKRWRGRMFPGRGGQAQAARALGVSTNYVHRLEVPKDSPHRREPSRSRRKLMEMLERQG